MPSLPPAIRAQLARLAPDQRAAATIAPGPVLCVAPAGSGKTTTLVARICWLVASGVDAATITAVTFNRRAAEDLSDRLTSALAPLAVAPLALAPRAAAIDPPRVRTFHALGREILADAGVDVSDLVDRAAILAGLLPQAPASELRRIDDAISRLKLDLRLDPRGEPAALARLGQADRPRWLTPGIARAYVAYESALRERGGLDFDDFIIRPLELLRWDRVLLARWRERCQHLLVDEVQDVDRSQLDLAVLLAGPEPRIFLVGDDDQTIYAWRLADVRRVIGLAARLPGLRRVDLTVNYRCPTPVVQRAVRLVERNHERFRKRISARPRAAGELILAPLPTDDVTRARRLLDRWLDEGLPGERRRSLVDEPGLLEAPDRTAPVAERSETRWAVLARTNAELAPYAAVALELGIPFAAEEHGLLLDDPRIDQHLQAAEAVRGGDATGGNETSTGAARGGGARGGAAGPGAEASTGAAADPLIALGRLAADDRRRDDRRRDDRGPEDRGAAEASPSSELLASLLAWAAPYPTLSALRGAIAEARARLVTLHRADTPLVLATVHGTKGLEYEHVAVVGLDEGRFPSRRSLEEAADPRRTLEEERRLAYVAWTRAKRTLTLVYDPGAPSPFLREAFAGRELGRD